MVNEEPFVKQHLDEEAKGIDAFTVRLNAEERELLNSSKLITEQAKDSTAIKQLAWIGAKVIHDEKIAYILGLIFKNKRKNKRLGIADFE